MFFEKFILWYIVFLSESSFGQHLLCIFNSYITMFPGGIKAQKLYIWPMFTWVNKKFVTDNPSQVCLLTARFVRWRNGVYNFVCSPVSNERTYDIDIKINTGRWRVTPDRLHFYQFTLLLEESKACAVIIWSIFSQILVMGRLSWA